MSDMSGRIDTSDAYYKERDASGRMAKLEDEITRLRADLAAARADVARLREVIKECKMSIVASGAKPFAPILQCIDEALAASTKP